MQSARALSAAVLLIFAAGAIPGCQLFSQRDKNAPLVAEINPPVADVPIPVGFVMTPDSSSKVVPGNAIRFVDHRYKGTDDVLPVVKFFRDHLPEKGWTWVDQSQARGNEVTLHYTKGNEHLYVTVNPGSWNRVYVRVKIDPAGREAQK
jgi:hypothetical protein